MIFYFKNYLFRFFKFYKNVLFWRTDYYTHFLVKLQFSSWQKLIHSALWRNDIDFIASDLNMLFFGGVTVTG